MFIGAAGGTNTIQCGNGRITLALTGPTGSVIVEQQDESTGWFPMVYDGDAVVLNSDNTVQSVYAPCKLMVTAVGTGVRISG